MSAEDKDLIVANTQQGISAKPEIDLYSARRVLEAIVGNHESKITEATPLDRIGEYGLEQIRNAVGIVASDLVDNKLFGDAVTKKITSAGNFVIMIFNHFDDQGNVTSPRSVYMALLKDGKYMLENEFPLSEPEDDFVNDLTRFSDFRSGTRVQSMSYLNENPSLEGYRQLVRGLRWMSANLLDWKTNSSVIMPEALDNPQIL